MPWYATLSSSAQNHQILDVVKAMMQHLKLKSEMVDDQLLGSYIPGA